MDLSKTRDEYRERLKKHVFSAKATAFHLRRLKYILLKKVFPPYSPERTKHAIGSTSDIAEFSAETMANIMTGVVADLTQRVSSIIENSGSAELTSIEHDVMNSLSAATEAKELLRHVNRHLKQLESPSITYGYHVMSDGRCLRMHVGKSIPMKKLTSEALKIATNCTNELMQIEQQEVAEASAQNACSEPESTQERIEEALDELEDAVLKIRERLKKSNKRRYPDGKQ